MSYNITCTTLYIHSYLNLFYTEYLIYKTKREPKNTQKQEEISDAPQ
jgi:hypothetical protein